MKPTGPACPLDAALAYAHRGWAVFPCHASAEAPGGCSCRRADCSSPAKHPRVAGGLTAATCDPAVIRRWWRQWPAANVAVRTGAVSGIVVVDIDPAHGGDASFEALLHRHGHLPPGAVARTGSGGRHLYFTHPGGIVRNDTGRRLGPGLDIRADGGYVIAPPSRHASGARYRWATSGLELAAPPDWLVARLREPAHPPTTRPACTNALSPTPASAWARAALERELAAVGRAQEGTRNNALNRAAFSLGQIIAGGALDGTEVQALLLDRAAAIGLSEREARTTIASGLSAGARQPRTPAATSIDLRTVPLPGTPSSVHRPPAPIKAPPADPPGPR